MAFRIILPKQNNAKTGKKRLLDHTATGTAFIREINCSEERPSAMQNVELRAELLRSALQLITSHSLTMDFMQSAEMQNFLALFAEFIRHNPQFPVETLFLGNFTTPPDNNIDGMDWANAGGEHAGDEDNFDSEGLNLKGVGEIIRPEPTDKACRGNAETERNSEIEQILPQLQHSSVSPAIVVENDDDDDGGDGDHDLSPPSCHEEVSANDEEIYFDNHGKQWRYVGQAAENSAEYHRLRTQHCLVVNRTWERTLNFQCKVKGVVARRRHIHNCLFRGLFVRETGKLYVDGTHNHAVESNGAVPRVKRRSKNEIKSNSFSPLNVTNERDDGSGTTGCNNNDNDDGEQRRSELTMSSRGYRREVMTDRGMVYIDCQGKRWNFLGSAEENSLEFKRLLKQNGLSVHNIGTDTINLACKVRGNLARNRQITNCPVRALFVRGTERMYIREEHNHPMGPNGEIRFKWHVFNNTPRMKYHPQHATPSTSATLSSGSNNHNIDHNDDGALVNLQDVKREEFGSLAQFI